MMAEYRIAFDLAKFLAKDSAGRTQLSYRNGDTIFLQGDRADCVFYLQQGSVKKSCVSNHGKERVIALLRAGEFFGTGCVIGRAEHRTTATAMTACSLMRIEKAAMLHVLHTEPKFAEMFISFLIDRVSHYQDDLVDHLFNPSEKRLARTLLRLCDVGKKDGQDVVLPEISQETLGQLVGTTRPRINYFMNGFRKRGFIAYKGKIRVNRFLLNKFIGESIAYPDNQRLPREGSPGTSKTNRGSGGEAVREAAE
jgi:CRP-like cAMP-binding protein